MKKLELPAFEYKIKKVGSDRKIFDPIRKKYVHLTPEEWVRQHLINYLVVELQYPRSLISVESGTTYNSLQKRTDLIVFDRIGNPFLLVECKRSEAKLSEDSFYQITTYNHSVSARYLLLTNGSDFLCYDTSMGGEDAWIDTIPAYPTDLN